MTTTYIKTTGIPLFKFDDTTYCRMIDVMKLIHHEHMETDSKEFHNILDRMEMRVAKNDFLSKTDKVQNKTMPPRYAVGRERNGKWEFFVKSENGKANFSDRPCMAKLYKTYRDASACADFLDGEWDVLDWEDNMSEEERWLRELNMPMPFDADDGNENAIPVQIVT